MPVSQVCFNIRKWSILYARQRGSCDGVKCTKLNLVERRLIPPATLPGRHLPQINATYRSSMANGLQNRLADAQGLLRVSALVFLCLGASALRAEVVSDLLIVLEPDGRHYVAQHTVATDKHLVVAELPATRISLETRFTGSERLTFANAHEQNPNRLSLWSGSAWTRYRHHYEEGLSESATGVFELNTDLAHAELHIDEPDNVQWSLTWILPGNAHLTDFQASAPLPANTPLVTTASSQAGDAPVGRWQTSGQVLTFRQSGGKLPALRIRYSLDTAESIATDPCLDSMADEDLCAPDSDGDTVPDVRDICLPPSSTITALRPPAVVELQNRAVSNTDKSTDNLGCNHDDPQVLAGVHFQSGQYYLDVASRNVLDRVARALQSMPTQRFEVGSHTDNAGRVDVNQRLSKKQATAVRHYLLVRGVEARQLTARGYGESLPVYDNAEAAGRRANRRTELRRIN